MCSRHIGVFRHLSLQKVRTPHAFNILTWKCARSTAACHFSASKLPKVVRSGPDLACFVHFDLNCALRHNAVHFSISHLATRPTNHEKNAALRNFPNISRACIFFLLTLSLSLFYSSPLCFSCLHIDRLRKTGDAAGHKTE